MKQRLFCREYIYDWNATRAYKAAYPNTRTENTASVEGHRLLRNPKIQSHLTEIQSDIEKIVGISKYKVLDEQMKIAYSSIAHLHNTWIERKDFEQLTESEKACISEISTQTRTVMDENGPSQVEFVKVKLYDKQKALDSISKMLGYDAPTRTELTGKDGKPLVTAIQIEVINRADQVRKDDKE